MPRLSKDLTEIDLRVFANISCIDMFDFCEGRREIVVVDDFGNRELTDTLMLSFTWFGLIVHRHFNDKPYHISENITLSGKDGYPTYIDDKLLQKSLKVFLPVVMLENDDPEVYDLIKQLNFVHQNLIHNYLSVIGSVAVVSIRAIDTVSIYYHPKIQKIKERRKNREISTEAAMKLFNNVLNTEKDFDKSFFALLYRTKGLDVIQSYNLMIERGPVFDLNGTIMPFNIDDSYIEGLEKPSDILADSKGGGFSLVSNGAALQDSEWFHMKVHHLGASILGVRYGVDCGTTKGMIVKVHSREFLQILQGSYYFKEDGSLELIWKETYKNIEIGSTIKIRSIAWCNHAHTGKPCSVCFGKMISSLPYNKFIKREAIPGLFFGSVFGEKTGQSILKSKHRIGDTSIAKFEVEGTDAKYINTDGSYIYFDSAFVDEANEPYLILDRDLYLEIADYKNMENLDDLNVTQIPVRKVISLATKVKHPMYDDEFAIEKPVLNSCVSSRQSRMTKSFIDFLRNKDVVEEGKGVKISLLGWNTKEPAYELPNINEDLNAYRERCEKFLTFEHLKSRLDEKITEEFHGEQFLDYWLIVQEQNKQANKIIYDILLYSCMVTNPKEYDYSLPSGQQDRYFSPFTQAFFCRGNGNGLMFGYQDSLLRKGYWKLLIKNRQRNGLEPFLQTLTYM